MMMAYLPELSELEYAEMSPIPRSSAKIKTMLGCAAPVMQTSGKEDQTNITTMEKSAPFKNKKFTEAISLVGGGGGLDYSDGVHLNMDKIFRKRL